MVLSLVDSVIGGAVTGALALIAVRFRALTPRAGAVAFAFGAIIVIAVGFPFLALLAVFLGGSVAATRYRFEEKRRQSVQEGTEGERGVSNVMAHILVPTALALASVLLPSRLPPATLGVLYTAALSFGSADTFASEFGVLVGHASSILTRRPVTPGTSGGVSAAGQVWAAVGALLTALVGLGFFLAFSAPTAMPDLFVAVAAIAGFLGCQVDSILGELVENRGYLTKGGTNLWSMIASVGIALALLAGVGARV